jgi:hypothetical protein
MKWAQNQKSELNVTHKKDVLSLRETGVSQRTAQQFGVATSTVGNVNKNRNMILKAWEENCTKKGYKN